MKKIALLVLLAASASAMADQYVRGHFRKDGIYVEPHVRSSPNSTTLDNYSTQGNMNPYTGKSGTEPYDPYKLQDPYRNRR